MIVEASDGDYRYLLQKKSDGTFVCTRMPVDDHTNCEELGDWSQLPVAVRVAFTRAQNPIA